MANAGQHHIDGVGSPKPCGHDASQVAIGPRSQEMTTCSYKKQETYRREAIESSANTSDQGRGVSNIDAWDEDIRDAPDTTSGSTRARVSSPHARSGSDSNTDSGTRGH